MLNFAVGPVMMAPSIKKIGGEDIPYFRTPEFSKLMFENESLIKKDFFAKQSSKVVFLTASGTGAMEATITNLYNSSDRLLIVNGGSFGQRLVDICTIHNIPYTEIKLPYGIALKEKDLLDYEKSGYTGFLVQACETSTGLRFDLKMIGEFCNRNGLLLTVDAVSGFMADPINMADYHINAILTGSQKALALAPGLSIVVLDEAAIKASLKNDVRSLYFNFNSYLKNMERGQTPFTPAVGILEELNYRLKQIDEKGITNETSLIEMKANYFRSKIKDLPFSLLAETPSNCCTAIKVRPNISAHALFETIKDNYGVFVCPNGGDLVNSVFRVGHIGYLSLSDYDVLLNVFHDLNNKKML